MAEENSILKLVYTFFLGLIIAIFIGVGISTFYVAPSSPEYPSELNTYSKEPTDEIIQKQNAFDKQMQTFDKDIMGPYNRNVSIMTLSASVMLLTGSLFLEKKKIRVIADGAMLGGLFTLLYSLGRSFASQNNKYSFIVVTIGLCVVIYLGYHKFTSSQLVTTKTKNSK